MLLPKMVFLPFTSLRDLSVWRPLTGPLHDWPLAVCDYTSMNPEQDLVRCDSVYPHKITETYDVFRREKHRWFYLADMGVDEMVIFKSFDSKATIGTARGNVVTTAALLR